jgi:hypothetical protein
VGDADARGYEYVEGRLIARAAHMQRTCYQIGAVELARDPHGESEFTGAGSQVFDAMRAWPAAAHAGESRERLERADQNASRLAFRFTHKIQAFVHSVNEIHVGMAGRTENHARSSRGTAPGMSGAIADPEVCFHLYNASSGAAADQDFSQAIARDLDGRTRVEIAREWRGGG